MRTCIAGHREPLARIRRIWRPPSRGCRTRGARCVLLAWLALALVAPSVASDRSAMAASKDVRRLRREPLLPFAPSVQGRVGALALGNPAALALADGLSVGLNGAAGGGRFDGERGTGWSLSADLALGGVGLGLALARTVEPAPPSQGSQSAAGLGSFALGVGARVARLLRIGAAVRPLLDVDDGVLTVDIGLVADLAPWFSLGATMQDALAATRYLRAPTLPIVAGPQLVFGAVAGEPSGAWQLAADLTWPDGAAARRVAAMMQLRVHDDVWVALDLRRALDVASGVGSSGGVAAQGAAKPAEVHAAATTRIAAQLRWIEGQVELAPAVWLDRDEAGGQSFGLGVYASWRLAGSGAGGDGRSARTGPRRGPRAGRRTPMPPDRGVAAAAQLPDRDLSEIARSVLALHAALAAERGADVCGWIASDGARLDVESVDPPFSAHGGQSRAEICDQLGQRRGPWGGYLRGFGPARVHEQMARFLPLLFRVHGRVIGVLTAERIETLAALVQRQAPELACRSYQVRPFVGLGGVSLVDVRIGCPGEAELTTLWIAEGDGYRLTRLAIDHRPGQPPPSTAPAPASAPADPPVTPPAGAPPQP